MSEKKPRLIISLLVLTLLVMTMGCSTEKNTPRSRWWQSFNTRYNVYYNGSQAYIDGSLEKEQGNVDNFTEMIPLYTVGNEKSRELGKSNYDKAIEKMEKAIKLHSIKKRPVWTKSRRKTPKDIEWLSRKEYNPFLWKAWMLMGRSQFYEGDFDGAASTFAYMSRLYATQPAIYGRARAWLAKSYIENDLLYDAEDVIRNMQRDSMHWRAQKEWDYTYADYYIHTGEYEKAIPYMKKVIKHEMRRKQKARERFLLGQLEAAVGNNTEAYKAYKKVIRMNPSYELEFNARIAITEVMAGTQAKKMIKTLKRMAASDKNTEYLDQVYYALGNVYLSQRDTARAIASYEKGNEKGTRNGIEKGVLLLKLGNLYWEKEKFSDARRCYNVAIGLLDKERPDYEELSNRSKVLDELVPFTDAVHLQDSLQALAKMDEKSRNAAIDRVIEALKKKEKEEKNKAAEAQALQNQQHNSGTGNRSKTSTTNTFGNQQSTTWYFYNPTVVQQGKQQFQRQWGKRENVDNWQRVNKTVVAGLGGEQEELTDEQRDSIAKAEATQDSLENVMDSAQNNPHKREYYLAQIPFTPEQVEASNAVIMDGLYHSGVIFKDKLDNLPLSRKALERLLNQYPTFEHKDDLYYHLFLLYSRMGEPQMAEQYVDKLKAEYPQSQWTAVLTDPYFKENARLGTHLEDSLYAATYDAFKADRFGEVAANTRISEQRFPLGANRDKFIFIGGLSKLNNGDANGCVQDMKTVVEKYPQSDVAELAGMIVNGVNEGRRLRGGKFDIGNVWDRRSAVLADSDSLNARKLSNERNTNFIFMFVYVPDSVDQNKLLFNLARYNFTSYMVRDFNISIEEADGTNRMTVSGFRNYDEALLYARQLYQQKAIVALAKKARPVIISEENLPLLGTNFSYDEYDKFYNKHFAPLKVSQFYLLTEPAEVTTEPEKEPEPTQKEIDDYLEGTTIPDVEEYNAEPQGTDIPATEQPQQQSQGMDITIPQNTEKPAQGTDITIPQNTEKTQSTGITVPQNTEKPAQGTNIPVQQNSEQPAQGTNITVPQNTEKPAQNTEEPVQDTENPVEGTNIPVPQSTEKPIQGTNIPVQQNTEKPAENTQKGNLETVEPTKGTTIVTEEPQQTTSEPQQGTIIPTEEPAQPVQNQPLEDYNITIPETEETPAQEKKATTVQPVETPVKEQKTTTTTPTEQPQKKTKKTDDTEGVDIYFDDSTDIPASTSKKKEDKKEENKKKESFDLEDEYYDLDGF